MTTPPHIVRSFIRVSDVVFSHSDIHSVVDTFYRRVATDPILQIPFQSVHDWPEHIERLTHFWWIKFGGEHYMLSNYNPVLKHYYAGFNDQFLKHWLMLFHQVLDEKLDPHQASLWKMISEKMGHGLSLKNEMIKQHLGAKNDGSTF